MSAYFIITEQIHDPAGMGEYAKAAAPTIAAHGGKVVVYDTATEAVEGQWHGNQTVVVQFDTVEAARAWHESPEYAEARKLREAAADSNAVIVKGF